LVEQLGGARVSGAEAIRLLGHQSGKAGSVDGLGSIGRHRPMMRPGIETAAADPAGRDRRSPISGWCSGRGAMAAAQELGRDVPGQATGSALQWRWRVKPQMSQ